MFVDYKTLSEEAKVWVYPSSRKFYAQEIEAITKKMQEFVENWKGGDENFTASYQILYSRFLIFIADKATPFTHAEINEQVQFVLQLQEEYKVALLDKMNVCFKQGEYVQYKELKDFKKLLKNKALTEKTIVFDNLIQTKDELENYWEVPISESWYSRFLKK